MEDTGARDFQNCDKVISMLQSLAFISVFPRYYASAETMSIINMNMKVEHGRRSVAYQTLISGWIIIVGK